MSQTGKIYVGDNGTILELECNIDISGATNVTVEILAPPSDTLIIKSADVISPSIIRVVLDSEDIPKSGTYKFQPVATIGAWTGRGSTGEFEISKKFT